MLESRLQAASLQDTEKPQRMGKCVQTKESG